MLVDSNFMPTQIEEDVILGKTKELCQTIVDQPKMASIRQRINTFLSDVNARAQFETVVNKGQALQEKQGRGLQPDTVEIADFEKHRDVLLKNSVAQGFLGAREELHEIQHSIQKYVSKTLELGRVPTEADLGDGACDGNGGCGCHH
jgi:cell fate (sporulation/competence/biofilm development) regulator YlbF (YheA/YmcA/DUF963 family)